jgi:fimbrial chaperone protein
VWGATSPSELNVLCGMRHMRNWTLGILTATSLALSATLAGATTLSISPISIEVQAPGGASRVTLENAGKDVVQAQIRVFKWVQENGKDKLVPTRDVVASPPAIKMEPGKKTVVRVVRISKTPVESEESYRLIVDEVPQPAKNAKAVSFAIQYSVPVFFTNTKGDQQLTWNARLNKGQLVVAASNSGTRRAKLSQMQLKLPDGSVATVAEGLAGYVLPGSSRTWVAKPRTLKNGSKILIVATSELGPINATTLVAGQ